MIIKWWELWNKCGTGQSFTGVFYFCESFPAFVIILVYFCKTLESKGGSLQQISRLEHEGVVVFSYFVGFLFWFYKAFVMVGVRTVRSHGRVKRRTAWWKSFSLSIILTWDVSHELSHTVAMIVGRFKGVLSNQPTRIEDHEIESGSSE